MSHSYVIFAVMLAWMFGPLCIYALAPRKGRDPYLWVAGSTLLGPLVALVFLALPARTGRAA